MENNLLEKLTKFYHDYLALTSKGELNELEKIKYENMRVFFQEVSPEFLKFDSEINQALSSHAVPEASEEPVPTSTLDMVGGMAVAGISPFEGLIYPQATVNTSPIPTSQSDLTQEEEDIQLEEYNSYMSSVREDLGIQESDMELDDPDSY